LRIVDKIIVIYRVVCTRIPQDQSPQETLGNCVPHREGLRGLPQANTVPTVIHNGVVFDHVMRGILQPNPMIVIIHDTIPGDETYAMFI
jgi:hypothetical protein